MYVEHRPTRILGYVVGIGLLLTVIGIPLGVIILQLNVIIDNTQPLQEAEE